MRASTVSTISDKMKIAASQNINERDYWLNKLSGDLVRSFFPYDHKERVNDERRLDKVKFQFTGELFSTLMQLSNKSDNRLHMVFTAGLATLLNKYTGNKDVIVGMPIHKQEMEGEFINTVLPLRNKLEADMTFKQLLLQVRQTIVEAADHQNYPMEALLYKLNIPSAGTGFALFDAAVLLENIHDKRYLKHINYNMLFSFSRTGDAIEGTLEYNTSLYEKITIEGIVTHFRQLFKVVISDLDLLLADIDILPGEEKRQILFDFNNTRAAYPQDKTIHALLETQVEKTPDKTAVIYNDQYLTYRALNEKANRLAGLLREKGVKQESIVGIIMEPSLELIIGIAGILKAGGAYLPIDPEYPGKRILSILRDSGAAILLTKKKIVNAVSFTSLKDIKTGNIEPVVTTPREQIKDFDGLPLPDRTLIDYEKYHQYIGLVMAKHTISLQATRGCPYNCAFCHKIWPKHHVARSAENIFEEIKHCCDAGVRRFAFIDDVFNLDKNNVARLMEKIIESRLDIQLFFPNGFRGDILNKEDIDLMVEAGTVNIDLALESASPRIQKLIRKNLNLEKLKETARYLTETYPHVLLEMELMTGFPTETEEEALMTIEFLENLKWVHFPYLNILKIYPNTDMYRLAVEKGISPERIERSTSLAFHELPETLPFSKSFAGQIQMRLMNDYFLSKERLLHVLPHQAKTLNQEELIQKYDSYLPMKIEHLSDILKVGRISREELGDLEFLPADHMAAPGFRENMRKYFPREDGEDSSALRVLLLDLSLLFSSDNESTVYDIREEPLGLTYLLTYLKKTFGRKIRGKIGKSRMDFDNYDQLQTFIRDFNPDLIGIRTLSIYKEFFHKTVSLMRQWGVTVPIIAGGPYATSDYQLVLNDASVDLVVLGEGEITFGQLLEKVLENGKKLPDDDVLKDIPGIAFVKNEDKIMLRRTGREVVFLDNIEEMAAPYPGENLDHVNQPGDLLYLISTSGSTGIPKSLMMEHRNLANLLNFQLLDTPVDFHRVLQFASIGFDVSSQEIFSALLAGGELYLMESDTKRDVYRMLELMRRNHLNVVYWPPAFLKYVFSEADHRARFPKSVEHIITAGEQLIVTEPIRRYIKENHVYLHNHYGPAETHVVTTFVMEPGGEIPEIPPIGKPIANTRIYILDENKKVKPVGTIGEVYIAGANVGRGYHRRKELTAEKFIPNPFAEGERLYRTGDLARWLPGGIIEFIGRLDYQVKIRGFRIELGEIENRLMEIDDIKEAAVVDFKDPAGEKYLCAYIVSEKEVEIPGIKDMLANDMPGYMVPSYFVQVEKIPVTPNGKIDKKALPMPELKVDEGYAAPRNEVEEELAAIWSEVLGIEKNTISIDADFFELGGHSLKATILITRMHKAFNIKITLGEMFQQATIRGLSQLIKEAGGDIFSAIEPEEKKEYYPLSSAQKRIYVLQRMEGMKISYNNPSIMVLRGEFSRENFEKVLQEMIKRHETLRTSFEMMGEEPVQRVHEIDDVVFEVLYHEMSEEEARKRAAVFVRPFELEQVPLLRVELVKLEEDRFLLMYDMHHIITDGTSMQVFAGEFMALYSGEKLTPLRIHYKDFSEWQNKLFASGKSKKQQEYWLKQFEGEIPVLNLPADFPRPEVQSYEGRCAGFQLGSEETRILREVVKEENATLYMALLTIYNLLLSKVSGQGDIVVGSPIAGRRHADLHFIIGMFVNTLALRNFPAAQKTFREFLAEVKKRTLAAFENQDYPFEELVDRLEVNRDASRNPLLDVVMVLQNMAVQSGTIPEVEPSGLRMEPHKTGYDISASKFDMTLVALETGDSLSFVLEYCTRLFRKDTIERFIAYFKRLTVDIRENLDKRISEIEIISPEEKNRLLKEFNQTGFPYPKDKTIHELYIEQMKTTPDHIAIVGAQGTVPLPGDHVSITYNELNEKSNQLAHHLRSKGVGPETIVAIMVERSIEMIIGILGILKAGGAYLPIVPEYPEERIDYMLKDSNTGALVTGRELSDMCRGTAWGAAHPAHKGAPTNLAYVIYTSGSTGRPKGVGVEHRSLVNAVTWQSRFYNITERDHTTQYASFGFDASVLEIFPPLTRGASLYIIAEENRLEPEKLNRYFDTHWITFSFLPTQLCEQFMEMENRSLRVLLAAGDKLRVFIKRNYQLYNNYGPTENAVVTTAFAVNKNYPGIPIGKPIHNNYIYILNMNTDGLHLQPFGAAGELCIGGDSLSRGYLNNPELTAERFITHHSSLIIHRFYRTGDLARWLPDGNIEFIGRIDLQVKIRGFRIEPGEIEKRLLEIEEITGALVIPGEVENETGERYLCAYIVTAKEIDVSRLKHRLSFSLPDYMMPLYFMQIETIPLTPNGKVDRKRLPVPGIVTGPDHVGPRDEVEERMVEMWSDLLGIEKEKIGMTANFFELGGHSLKATTLVARIHKVFNTHVPVEMIFKRPTIRRLAAYISGAAKALFISIQPVEKRGYYELSSAQKRLFVIQQMAIDSVGYNTPLPMVLEGKLDKKYLEQIIGKLIKRHESLRTSFVMINQEPVQSIHEDVEFEVEYYEKRDDGQKSKVIHDFVRSFDLSQAPLLRVVLFQMEKQEHVLILDMHHIITDGISQAVLAREFMDLYAGKELKPLRIQYKDYVQWQKDQKERLKKQEQYWLNVFKAEVPVLNLPFDYPRPVVQSFDGYQIGFVLDIEETKRLREMAAEHGATLYMVLLGIFNVLLAKISGQEDIVVGVPIAGRGHAELEPVIGMFVNTLAIRNLPSPQKAFDDFLQEVKKQTLGAFENQGHQFEDLVEQVPVNRDVGRNPLFDVMFVLQNVEYPVLEIPGLKLKPYEYEMNISKFDLTLTGIEGEQNLLFSLEYCTKLFKKETIERFIEYFKKIVSLLVEKPGVTLSEIDIVSKEERDRLLFEFNRTAAEYPKNKTIPELFEEQVGRTPDSTAVVGEEQIVGAQGTVPLPGDHVSITYKELNEKANHLARLLQQKGVQPGTIVGIMVERCIEMIVGIFAILKAGGAYLPINPDYPQERIEYMLSDSNAKVLLAAPAAQVKEETVEIIDIFKGFSSSTSTLTSTSSPTASAGGLAYVIYTSGTTSWPRGVVVSHGNVIPVVRNTNYIQLSEADRVLQLSNYAFDGSIFDIFGALLNGSALVLVGTETLLDAHRLLDFVRRESITVFFVTTALFNTLVDVNSDCFSGVRKILFGGERVSVPHALKAFKHLGKHRILHMYGPTETTVYATFYSIDAVEGRQEIIPIGTPVSNTAIYILDQGFKSVPIGIIGEIYIGGPRVAPGYLNRPELTEERFVDYRSDMSYRTYFSKKLYKTGDLGRWLPDGNIEFSGRIDHQVKIRGFRIEPGEIENRLLEIEEITEAVVIPRELENREKYLCAYMVSEKEISTPELRSRLSACLPDYMIPAYFTRLDQFPLNPNGKIDRRALPEPDIRAGEKFAAPRSEIEKQLVNIWSETLGRESQSPIGIDDNFFDLGGHSLKAAGLVSRIHKELKVQLPLTEVFKRQTIRELAQYIEHAGEKQFDEIEAVEAKEFYELSYNQKRLWIIRQLEPKSTSYHMIAMITLNHKVNEETVRKVLQMIIERHESLRTRFEVVNNNPVQLVDDYVDIPFKVIDMSTLNKEEKERKSAQVFTEIITAPFDFSQAPLFRSVLLKVDEETFYAVFTLHHIVTDGWSMEILKKEFSFLYETFKKEEHVELEPVKLRYKDFSAWHNKQVENPELKEKSYRFWEKKLQKGIPEFHLPADFSIHRDNKEGADYRCLVSEDIKTGLKNLARDNNTTLSMAMLSAYIILLSQLTGQPDITCALISAGRDHISLANIVGYFTKLLMIITRVDPDETFEDFLGRVDADVLEIFEIQNYPIELVLDELKINYPDTPAAFNMLNLLEDTTGKKIEDFDSHHSHDNNQEAEFDIELYVTEYKNGIELLWRYRKALFKPSTIELITEGYLELLDYITQQ